MVTGSRRRKRGVPIVAVLVLLGLLPLIKVTQASLSGPPSDDRQAAAVRALDEAIADGADGDMQQLFPEGSFFLHVLTGIAAARSNTPDGPDRARAHLARTTSPAELARFGTGMESPHGIFADGWNLYLAATIAQRTNDPADRQRVTELAEPVAAALADADSPFLQSYPGQAWPCDSVVAVAALAQSARISGEASGRDWLAVVNDWRSAAMTELDPGTGLLPHRTAPNVVGPQGSSQAIIQTFWPDIVAATGVTEDDQWRRFVDTFVTREYGLVGVREFPHGVDGEGDVDSGPLIAGVSASASAVTLAAAHRNGDQRLASTLDREAELLGLRPPFGTRYALGQMPIGDAFLAFAHSAPRSEPYAPLPQSPSPLWWVFAGLCLVPVGLGVWLAVRRL
ncbi:hypothetical protein ACQCX2_10715 [Propionibacteriaceae bacterium Y1700]|uniref:hypothetical protein n=1 Tax=Microlunatus sp. Y1700 TaxID=3418487 RepID=UPI003DA7098D